MYERSAIVLEKYFEKLFNFDKENNLRANYMNYIEIVEQLKEYQKITEEEEVSVKKFDEVAKKIEEIQRKQTKLHESNMKLEEERNKSFGNLSENPGVLDAKIKKIEEKVQENNEEQKSLHEEYIQLLEIFIERQKERNTYTRERRRVETAHVTSLHKVKNMFEKIDKKEALAIKKFITIDKDQYKETLIDTMQKNGKNEKIPFNKQVIEKAVEARIEIAEKESEIYISVYEKTKKLLDEIEANSLKLVKAEKTLRDTSVKLNFLKAKKEYIVSFLDNERITAINGKKVHDKIMEEACENFDADIAQINNLYELVLRETVGKSTKKAYKELYNKTYLKDIQEKEKNFEKEATGVRANIGTLVNFNYWRIEGVKNVYSTFQADVTEKFERDLSEFQIEEPEEEILEELFSASADDNEEYEFNDNEDEEQDVKEEVIEEIKVDEDEEYQFDDDDDDDEEYQFDDDGSEAEDEEEYEFEFEDDDYEDDSYFTDEIAIDTKENIEKDDYDYEIDEDVDDIEAIMYIGEKSKAKKEEKTIENSIVDKLSEEKSQDTKINKKGKHEVSGTEEQGIFMKLFRKNRN